MWAWGPKRTNNKKKKIKEQRKKIISMIINARKDNLPQKGEERRKGQSKIKTILL